jgi:glycosyltransferase involved in cell wall biosynthesis
MEAALPGPPLRIAVLGDFDGQHTRRWIEVFVARGHDVHAISYFRPQALLPGVQLHVLAGQGEVTQVAGGKPRTTEAGSEAAGLIPQLRNHAPAKESASSVANYLPRGLTRLIHAWRYRRAGLRPLLDRIAPDVFHAHYVVEHGFYGAVAGYRPYVVSAWGSDLLVEPRSASGRAIARYALRRADLVTANDRSLARKAVELGVPEERVHVIHLGIDDLFFREPSRSVNRVAGLSEAVSIVISDRALEPLYNVDVILRAFARLRERLPDARLVVANDGSERKRLEGSASELGLGESVRFTGRLSPEALRDELEASHVYVSMPASDSFPLSTYEAMATGCFPVVSDLPSQAGLIEDGVNGLVVPPRDAGRLATALTRALGDASLRRDAAAANRRLAETHGRREANLLALERLYYRLAGHPVGGAEAI